MAAWQLSVFILLSTLTMLAVYFLAFVPGECRRKKRGRSAKQLINGYWPYVLLAAAVYGLTQAQFPIQRELNLFVNYDCTHYVECIEGGMVAVFQSYMHPTLTYLMTFVYLVLFTSVISFTFLVLAYTEQMKVLKLFSLAFVLNYLIALPFYLFFPVKVTGYTLPDVQPLMYELHPMIYEGITTVDPLDNCFPSLHVALVFSALLAIRTTSLRRYATFLVFAFLEIVFATLYLGVHWATDIVAGIALSFLTFHLAKLGGEPILDRMNRAAVRFERLAGFEVTVVCTACACSIAIAPHLRSARCPRCGAVVEHSVL